MLPTATYYSKQMNTPACLICHSIGTVFFCKKEHYAYFSCKNCRTLFLSPSPSSEDINSLYEGEYNYRVDHKTEKRLRNNAKRILKTLQYLHPQGKTLLDIGSGFGFFLEESIHAGFSVTGLEPAKNLFKYSTKTLKLPVFNASFHHYFANHPKKSFDFISLIHVIEHLPNPSETIRLISKHLNKNGILYIETPNLDSWLFKTEQTEYTFLTPPDHLFLFSKKSFSNIIKNNSSVSVIKRSSHSYPEHFMGITKKLICAHVGHRDIQPAILNNISPVILSKAKNPIKYMLFDDFIAPILTPLLNVGIYGSVLELYIKKK